MPEYTLRPATEADAAALSKLGRETFTRTFGHLYTQENLTAFLDGVYAPALQLQEIHAPEYRVMLAELEGKLVGYATSGPCKLPIADKHPQAFELYRIYILPEGKGQGIGSALVEDALRFFAESGAPEVYVGVWSENFPAHAFYHKLGFEKVGEYHFMVGNHADDEWIMRLTDWKTRKQGFSTAIRA